MVLRYQAPKNPFLIIASLIEHICLHCLPVPKGRGEEGEGCLWGEEVDYGDQLDVLMLLGRLSLHYLQVCVFIDDIFDVVVPFF